MEPDVSAAETASRFVSAPDGLRLHYRDYGPRANAALPVVCLPGLARTGDDFARLAAALAGGKGGPRRVLTLDYRGRGLSQRDRDPKNYDVRVEAADVLAVAIAAGVEDAIFVGTSRGGLITMALAVMRPSMIKGVVLNDIGPVLEPKGLARIRGYVGKLPQPRSWTDAVSLLQGLGSRHFTGLTDAEWLDYAELTFAERNGAFSTRYDPALTRALQDLDLENLPVLWPQFDALRSAPLLVVRGGNSDLLSAETAEKMIARHPEAVLHTVEGQGHAPLLTDAETIARVEAFVAQCQDRWKRARPSRLPCDVHAPIP